MVFDLNLTFFEPYLPAELPVCLWYDPLLSGMAMPEADKQAGSLCRARGRRVAEFMNHAGQLSKYVIKF
jgi:hypothetical protein